MDTNEIYTKIKQSLVDSCGLEAASISPDKTLIGDLNIDSIDLIDLLYTIEKDFNVTIKISEFENLAQAQMGSVPFAVNNVVTTEGLEALKKLMPEIDASKIQTGLTVYKVPYLFTVQSLVNIVKRKLG